MRYIKKMSNFFNFFNVYFSTGLMERKSRVVH